MDINNLTNAIKEIEKNVKILENSKFEETRELIINGANVKFTLKKQDLEKLYSNQKIKGVEKFVSTNKFCKVLKLYKINGGFIILR